MGSGKINTGKLELEAPIGYCEPCPRIKLLSDGLCSAQMLLHHIATDSTN